MLNKSDKPKLFLALSKIDWPGIAKLLTVVVIGFGFYGCAPKNYGDNLFRLQLASHGKDVIWMPTKIEMAHEMLTAANTSLTDIVYDLGSGDGVIPIEAAKKFGVRAVGIEYNPDLVELSKRNAKRSGVEELVSFRQGDIFIEDFSEATILTLYLGESLNARLMPKIFQMRPGTRVVSNTFQMGVWTPDRIFRLSSGEQGYLWIVPAQIDGIWDLSGFSNIEVVKLQIRQRKQFFDGNLISGSQPRISFEEGLIQGETIRFEFLDRNRKRRTLEATISGDRLSGSLTDGESRMVITGRRVQLRSSK